MTRIALLAVALLAGCAPKMFVHPNPGAVNQLADASRCEYEIEMAQQGVRVPYWYNNNQAAGYLIGAAIGQAIRYDRLRTLCMQSKGYIAVPLAAGPFPGVTSAEAIQLDANQRYPISAAQPGRADIAVAPPPPIAAAPVVAASIKADSKYLITAEGVAKAEGCIPPAAAMTSKGAGMEMFAIACPNGTTLAIRCEIDGCRVLR